MRKIDKIILHCTATPEGRDYTVEQIREWHVKGNGWQDIAYHFVIYRDGSIHEGRPLAVPGAHCYGHNVTSIGIAYVGGCTADGSSTQSLGSAKNTPKDTRTPQQREALYMLVDQLKIRFPGVTVHCHNEFANKACPSFKICDF